MLNLTHVKRGAKPLALLAAVALLGPGCPYVTLPDPVTPSSGDYEYDKGFDEGFMEDDWYWQGFDDSYDTVDGGPIYYQGSTIAYVESPPYEAGYWDGVWYAYNDGYFVCYDYAFSIGFSEGYDCAYAGDYLAFLASDEHVEWYDGGWSDGYNDGFSEGRVFGANDYETSLAFDWLDALLDYREGTDLYFEEIDVGTGLYGPVYLYEYGTDPAVEKALSKLRPSRGAAPSIRKGVVAKAGDPPPLSYRALPADVRDAFDKQPETSARSDRKLKLKTTWLERVNAYAGAAKSGAKSLRTRAVAK